MGLDTDLLFAIEVPAVETKWRLRFCTGANADLNGIVNYLDAFVQGVVNELPTNAVFLAPNQSEVDLHRFRQAALSRLRLWESKVDAASEAKLRGEKAIAHMASMREAYFKELNHLREQLYRKNKAEEKGQVYRPEDVIHFDPTMFTVDCATKKLLHDTVQLVKHEYEIKLENLMAHIESTNEKLRTTKLHLTVKEKLLKHLRAKLSSKDGSGQSTEQMTAMLDEILDWSPPKKGTTGMPACTNLLSVQERAQVCEVATLTDEVEVENGLCTEGMQSEVDEMGTGNVLNEVEKETLMKMLGSINQKLRTVKHHLAAKENLVGNQGQVELTPGEVVMKMINEILEWAPPTKDPTVMSWMQPLQTRDTSTSTDPIDLQEPEEECSGAAAADESDTTLPESHICSIGTQSEMDKPAIERMLLLAERATNRWQCHPSVSPARSNDSSNRAGGPADFDDQNKVCSNDDDYDYDYGSTDFMSSQSSACPAISIDFSPSNFSNQSSHKPEECIHGSMCSCVQAPAQTKCFDVVSIATQAGSSLLADTPSPSGSFGAPTVQLGEAKNLRAETSPKSFTRQDAPTSRPEGLPPKMVVEQQAMNEIDGGVCITQPSKPCSTNSFLRWPRRRSFFGGQQQSRIQDQNTDHGEQSSLEDELAENLFGQVRTSRSSATNEVPGFRIVDIRSHLPSASHSSTSSGESSPNSFDRTYSNKPQNKKATRRSPRMSLPASNVVIAPEFGMKMTTLHESECSLDMNENTHKSDSRPLPHMPLKGPIKRNLVSLALAEEFGEPMRLVTPCKGRGRRGSLSFPRCMPT